MKQNTIKTFRLAVLGVSIAGLVGCASGPDVSYVDSKKVETVNVDFGSTDLQSIAEARQAFLDFGLQHWVQKLLV